MLKMQKSTDLEKNDIERMFDRFEVQVVTVWSSQLGKTPNACISAYGRFITHFKRTHFLRLLKDF